MARSKRSHESPFGPPLSQDKVRRLDSEQLELSPPPSVGTHAKDETHDKLPSEIADNDAILLQVKGLFADGYAGVILSGPPGTGKTYYARQVAAKLVDGDRQRARFIQFHPSYQYEDFVEGFVPTKDGKFVLKRKHFLKMCLTADRVHPKQCVLVIDELSRCNPGRIFGEALTYIEMALRGKAFSLASGRRVVVPSNLLFLATMNTYDRGVDDVDAALERRFVKIRMDPDAEKLLDILGKNGVQNSLASRVVRFFRYVDGLALPEAHIGHAYFINVKDEESLRRLWDHQLKFHFEKAFRLSPQDFSKVERAWQEASAEE